LELYKIGFRGVFHYYTASQDIIVFDNIEYIPEPIKRTELTLELKESEVRVVAPLTLAPFDIFIAYPPSSTLTLEIKDADSGYTLFEGILQTITFKVELGTCEGKFSRRETFFDSLVPYRTYGSGCSFNLFDKSCAVDKTSNTFSTSSFVVSGGNRVVTADIIAAQPLNSFLYGYVLSSLGETFFVVGCTGNSVTLDSPLMTSPEVLSFIKGCDKSYECCTTKFNNGPNFGGFPLVPAKNPSTESI